MLSNKLKITAGILLRLIVAAGVWYSVTLACVYGIGALLLRLLASWGVTYENLSYYPRWVQYLVTYQTGIYSAAAATITIAISAPLIRGKNSKPCIKGIPLGFAAGVLVSALFAAFFLLTDSMRPYTLSAGFSVHTLISLAILSLTSLAEAFLAFGYIRLFAQKRCGNAAGYLCAVFMFCVMDGLRTTNAIGIINLVLMALVLCFISERYGILTAAALRTGFTWGTSALIGFTGADTAVFRLYPVSESLLTGGMGGPTSGLALTIICLIPLLILLFRQIKNSRK